MTDLRWALPLTREQVAKRLSLKAITEEYLRTACLEVFRMTEISNWICTLLPNEEFSGATIWYYRILKKKKSNSKVGSSTPFAPRASSSDGESNNHNPKCTGGISYHCPHSLPVQDTSIGWMKPIELMFSFFMLLVTFHFKLACCCCSHSSTKPSCQQRQCCFLPG